MATKSSAPAIVAHTAMVTMLISGISDLGPSRVGQVGEVMVDPRRALGSHDEEDAEACRPPGDRPSASRSASACLHLPRLPIMAQSPCQLVTGLLSSINSILSRLT